MQTPQVKGEIGIITDANAFFLPDSVRNVVSYFADPAVGGVVGDWNLLDPGTSVMATNEDFIAKLERFFRQKEAGIVSIVNFSGEFTAYGRELFTPLPENSISEDMEMAIQIRKKG